MTSETPEEWKARIGVGEPSLVGQVVGGPGTTRTTVVPDETARRIAGTQTDHWDGRRDATIRPLPAKLTKQAHGPGVGR